MKIVGGVLIFLLIVGIGFIVMQLFSGTANAASGGNWLTKPAQSSTTPADVIRNIQINPSLAQARTGRGAF